MSDTNNPETFTSLPLFNDNKETPSNDNYQSFDNVIQNYSEYIVPFDITDSLPIGIMMSVDFIPGFLLVVSIMMKTLFLILISSSLLIIINLLFLGFNKKNIKFIKNEPENKLEIRIINFLCFTLNKFNVPLKNIHFSCKRVIIHKRHESSTRFTRLYMINDYKNLAEIDLDSSNIKENPAKIFYIFDYIKGNNLEIEAKLNIFVKSSLSFYNPLFFNINKYMNEKIIFDNFNDISNYMLAHEHFFTFYILKPERGKSYTWAIILGINYFVLSLVAFFPNSVLINISIYLYIAVLIASCVLLNLLIYYIYKIIYDKIRRIDCIYSNDFDRIFVGLVKRREKSYKKTFIFQLSDINKFNLRKNNDLSFILEAILYNNSNNIICEINGHELKDLEGLLYLLNLRLKNNNN